MCGELVCGQCSPHRVRLDLGVGSGGGANDNNGSGGGVDVRTEGGEESSQREGGTPRHSKRRRYTTESESRTGFPMLLPVLPRHVCKSYALARVRIILIHSRFMWGGAGLRVGYSMVKAMLPRYHVDAA